MTNHRPSVCKRQTMEISSLALDMTYPMPGAFERLLGSRFADKCDGSYPEATHCCAAPCNCSAKQVASRRTKILRRRVKREGAQRAKRPSAAAAVIAGRTSLVASCNQRHHQLSDGGQTYRLGRGKRSLGIRALDRVHAESIHRQREADYGRS